MRSYRRMGWLRIGAVHHDPVSGSADDGETLRDAAEFDGVLAPELSLLLHGRTHDAHQQYRLITFQSNKITQYARRYLADERRWTGTVDTTRTRLDEGNGTVDPDHAEYGQRDRDAMGVRVPDFVRRVAELVPLRHEGARVAEVVEGTPVYLRVVRHSDGMTSSWPVGVYEQGVTEPVVAEFAQVHRRFAADDPNLRSEMIYGGIEPVTDELVAQARRSGIRLMSLIEYQGLLDLRAYTRGQAERVNADKAYPHQLYVPQRYRMLAEAPELARPGLLDTVVDWLDEEQACFVLLLADFGHGKTFLLRELTRELPDRLPHVIPVLVELRTLEKAPTLDELLAMHLTRAEVKRIERDKLRSMVHSGRVALLFDGFDELVLRISYPQAADYLRTLLASVEGEGSRAKVVVTSRTQHFASAGQINSLLGERRHVLRGRIQATIVEGFSPEQIFEYLRNLYGDEERAQARKELIGHVHDLLGLSENPRMLSFIAALPDERLNQVRQQEGMVSASDLYRELIGFWLGYETGRLRHRGGPAPLDDADRFAGRDQPGPAAVGHRRARRRPRRPHRPRDDQPDQPARAGVHGPSSRACDRFRHPAGTPRRRHLWLRAPIRAGVARRPGRRRTAHRDRPRGAARHPNHVRAHGRVSRRSPGTRGRRDLGRCRARRPGRDGGGEGKCARRIPPIAGDHHRQSRWAGPAGRRTRRT